MAILCLLGAAGRTQASELFAEAFDYSDGPLVTVSTSWVHHSGATTGEVQVISGRAFLTRTNTEDVSRLIPGQPYYPSNSPMLYASFTLNLAVLPASSVGDYFAHFKAAGASGFNDNLFVTTNGVPAGFYRLGLANGGSSVTVVVNSNLSPNVDYFVVTRYQVGSATSTLWVGPSSEASAGVTATDITSGTNTIYAFALRESTGIGSLFVDNLTVGTQFTDVLPVVKPSITVPPQDQTVFEGSNATFTVTAAGKPAPGYQWLLDGNEVAGANSSVLVLPSVSLSQSGSVYSVVVTNPAGSVTSAPALLVVTQPVAPPTIDLQPESQSVLVGADVTLSVSASGPDPIAYQWQFFGTNLPVATNALLLLADVTAAQAGPYSVGVSNPGGSVTSQVAQVTVNVVTPPGADFFSVLAYNVAGNGVTDWSTNSTQVQGIGRQMSYLRPDIITFNEIPNTQVWQMTNFVACFLPGYFLADNSVGDGFIRNVILSRFPILSSKSYLHASNLDPYGYTNSNFTRDLFSAQIAVPGFPQPLDVFVAHLKATTSSSLSGRQSDADKRAAEASAVSNFFYTNFTLTASNRLHPYLLSGDLNEDVLRPPPTNQYVSRHPIQRLVSLPTGLQLTTPLNPITHTDLTITASTLANLNARFDYVLPSTLLFSNILSSQVFRTDVLDPTPAGILKYDSTNSDHLPVMVVFANPFATRLAPPVLSNQTLTLSWNSLAGYTYRLESSANLVSWTLLATNLLATTNTSSFTTNGIDPHRFFRIGMP